MNYHRLTAVVLDLVHYPNVGLRQNGNLVILTCKRCGHEMAFVYLPWIEPEDIYRYIAGHQCPARSSTGPESSS